MEFKLKVPPKKINHFETLSGKISVNMDKEMPNYSHYYENYLKNIEEVHKSAKKKF